MKVILEARRIPDNATVTKPTGKYEYTLVREIRFFHTAEVDKNQNIKSKEGCVFLVGKRGNVNVYPPTTMLAWVVSEDRFHEHLHKLEDDRYYG